MATVPKFDGDANALFRRQLRVVERIRLVGFGMAMEDSNHLLHELHYRAMAGPAHSR